MKFNPEQEFIKQQAHLQSALTSPDPALALEKWANVQKAAGFTKQQIYEVASRSRELVDSLDGEEERIYDCWADFLDRFTAWGNAYRLWPEEPDVDSRYL